jgi:hypothetical protein
VSRRPGARGSRSLIKTVGSKEHAHLIVAGPLLYPTIAVVASPGVPNSRYAMIKKADIQENFWLQPRFLMSPTRSVGPHESVGELSPS